MAALLRSSRVLSRFLSSARCFSTVSVASPVKLCSVYSQQAVVRPLVSKRLLASQAASPAAAAREDDASSLQSRLHNLDRTLYRIDNDVRRSGRVSRREVDEVFAEVKRIGSVTASQGLLLVRSCGSFLREESPEERTQLVDRVWSTLQELKCPMDVSHYNALLQVYLENEVKFSPTDFLATMEKTGIQANRVTYQRLIHRFCQEGDISGASKILEHMKGQDLPINEKVFNSLIVGHARANDMENAKNILDVMRNAHLEPTADTYFALLRGHAERGDMESMNKVLQELERNDVFLLDDHYLGLVNVLACFGHKQHVDQVLERTRRLAGYTQDCINTCMELLARGHDDVAHKVFLTMTSRLENHGNFFVSQLVRCDAPLEKIMHYCNDFKSRGFNTRALVRCTEVALLNKKADLAVALINEMHRQELPVRHHYFYPVILSKAESGKEEDVYAVLKLMADLELQPNYDTLGEFAFPAVDTSDPERVVEKLRGIGMSVAAIVNPLVYHYLNAGNAKMALSTVEQFPVNLVPSLLVPAMVNNFRETNDAVTLVKLLALVGDGPAPTTASRKRTDWAGRFILDCLSSKGALPSEIITWLVPELAANDVKIGHSTAETLRARYSKNLSPSILDMLDKISTEMLDESDPSGPGAIPSQNDMTIEELESHLVELKNKGMNTRGALRRLLLLHCRFRNLDRAMEIAEQLKKEGSPFTGAMHAQLLDLFVSVADLDKALEHHKLVYEVEPSFRLDDYKILNLAALMVSKGRFEEALKLVEDSFSAHGVKDSPESLQRNVFRLLSAVSQHGTPEQTQQAFDSVVLKCKFAPPSNLVLGPLVRCHLLRDDLAHAMSAFETCAKAYKHTPMKNELSRRFIEKEDSESLQRVVDISTEVHGEMNTLYDLMSYFLECGHVRQAQKILETPGLRARHQRLDQICETFLQRNMITELEQLVQITKDLFDVNRDAMYFFLLRAYASVNDVGRALDVWTKMQEENVQPSARTLRFLGSLLQKEGRPLPFEVPAEEDDRVLFEDPRERSYGGRRPARSRTPAATTTGESFESLVNSDVDRALDKWQRMADSNTSLSHHDTSLLIEALIQKERIKDALRVTEELLSRGLHPLPRVLKFLLLRLANLGEVDKMQGLRSQLPDQVLRSVSFDNLVCNAYVYSGRFEELLASMETDPAAYKTRFPMGGILGALKDHPDLEDRILALAKSYADDHQFLPPMNAFWIMRVLRGDYEGANKILEEYPQLKERLMFSVLLRESREKQKEELARYVVDTVASTPASSPEAKALAYGNLIRVLVAGDKLDEAVQELEGARAKFGLELTDFRVSTLQTLKAELISAGKQVPFEVPQARVR
ncbi:unnamed protein product, partial [Ixodes hexagonus]